MNHSYLLSLLLPKPMTHLVFTFIFVPLASTFLLLICRKLCFPTAEVLENIFPKALENRGFSNDLYLRLWVAEKALRVMRHDSAGGPSLFIGKVGSKTGFNSCPNSPVVMLFMVPCVDLEIFFFPSLFSFDVPSAD